MISYLLSFTLWPNDKGSVIKGKTAYQDTNSFSFSKRSQLIREALAVIILKTRNGHRLTVQARDKTVTTVVVIRDCRNMIKSYENIKHYFFLCILCLKIINTGYYFQTGARSIRSGNLLFVK